jgi:hypothetical protein
MSEYALKKQAEADLCDIFLFGYEHLVGWVELLRNPSLGRETYRRSPKLAPS